MKRNSLNIITCMFLSMVVFTTNAQKPVAIDLETVLRLGGANNLTIKEYKQRQELAIANITQAKEWWLPDVYAGIQAHQLSGAVMNGNGNFFLDVSRENLWMGLGLNATWDFANGIYEVKAERLDARAAEFQTQAKRNDSLLEIIESYFDFLSAQLSTEAYRQLASQADTISRQIEIQVQAGLRYQSELLLSKSNLNHLKVEMLNAMAGYYSQSAKLVNLLNLDPAIKLVSIDSIMSPLTLISEPEEDIRFDYTYSKRPDIQEMHFRSKALEMERNATTKGLLFPELSVGTYGSYFGRLNGQVTPMVPAEYPETKKLYPTNEVNVSLMWRIPLGRVFYAGDLKKYDAQLRIQQVQTEQVKAQVNNEIINSLEQLKVAKVQMELALEGSNLAEEALSQSIQRQLLGTVRPFEILQAQEVFIKSRLNYLNAMATYNKQQYRLFVGLGNNL
ncbi:MAG: TolC family protein [Cyclobacteriaceae bacterium]